MGMKFNRHNRNQKGISVVSSVTAAVCGAVLFAACATSSASPTRSTEVIAIDRTGSTRGTGTWPTEVTGIVKGQISQAFEHHIDTLTLISIGSDLADTAKVAQVTLDNLGCNNANTCADARSALANDAATAASQVAATPVSRAGTDILAAIETARALCGTDRCSITLVTDGGDSRLATPGTAEQLAHKYGSELPVLDGVSVQLIGLGADGSNAMQVDRTQRFWTILLKHAGVTDPTIARSL
jgi:hypothetical protein